MTDARAPQRSVWGTVRVYLAAAVFALLIVFDLIVAGMSFTAISAASDKNNEIGAAVDAASSNVYIKLMMHKLSIVAWCLSLAVLAWLSCVVALIRYRTSPRAASAVVVFMAIAAGAQWYASLAGTSMDQTGGNLPVPSPFAVLFWYVVVAALTFGTLRLAFASISRALLTLGLSGLAVFVVALLVGISGHGLATQVAAAESRPTYCTSEAVSAEQAAVRTLFLYGRETDRSRLKRDLGACLQWARSTGNSEIISAYQPLNDTVSAIEKRPAECIPWELKVRVEGDARTANSADIQAVRNLLPQCMSWASSSDAVAPFADSYRQLALLLDRDLGQRR